MKNEKIREKLCEMGFDNPNFFEFPFYDNSIIGITNSGNVVYDYEKMVDELAEEFVEDVREFYAKEYNQNEYTDDEINETATMDAIEFIDYNTIRSLPYEHICRPFVIYKNPETEEVINTLDGSLFQEEFLPVNFENENQSQE